jgi:hypothetical protein
LKPARKAVPFCFNVPAAGLIKVAACDIKTSAVGDFSFFSIPGKGRRHLVADLQSCLRHWAVFEPINVNGRDHGRTDRRNRGHR